MMYKEDDEKMAMRRIDENHNATHGCVEDVQFVCFYAGDFWFQTGSGGRPAKVMKGGNFMWYVFPKKDYYENPDRYINVEIKKKRKRKKPM